jgi:anti-anti-sigma factor
VSEILADSAPALLGWSRRHVDGAEVIFLVGELDLAVASELRQRLTGAVEASTAARILLDLSGVTFLDAYCTGIMIVATETAAARGRQLRVCGLSGVPKRVFEVLELESMVAHPIGSAEGGRG